MRTAEVIAVGSELLGMNRTDTNSLYISQRLSEIGVDVRVKTIVGDERRDLASVFRQALERVDVVVLTGGLGPTDDDLTREVVADVLDLPISVDETIVEKIRARFERRGLTMPEVNRRQAQVPRGAMVLDNPNGTAPGLYIEHAGVHMVVEEAKQDVGRPHAGEKLVAGDHVQGILVHGHLGTLPQAGQSGRGHRLGQIDAQSGRSHPLQSFHAAGLRRSAKST